MQGVSTGGGDTGDAVDLGLDMEESSSAGMVEPPEVYCRPKRQGKPNVRYSSEEYDLSGVSVSMLGQVSRRSCSIRRGGLKMNVRDWCV